MYYLHIIFTSPQVTTKIYGDSTHTAGSLTSGVM